MKKIISSIALVFVSLHLVAQLNVQMHYDFGNDIYGRELSNRPQWTATIENFTADKWGSTYFFVDGNFANNKLESVYTEISRDLYFGKSHIALHIEYNGGLSGTTGSYNDAYLTGIAYNMADDNFCKTLSFQLLYKYLANQVVGTNHSWQFTTVWGFHFDEGLYSFSGYADIWHDDSVNGSLILSSEPQFWVNLWKLDGVDDDCKLSVGTEVEICNNLVWPTDGFNNRFYLIPTLAAKWTF
jgi:hypothetical protein